MCCMALDVCVHMCACSADVCTCMCVYVCMCVSEISCTHFNVMYALSLSCSVCVHEMERASERG